MPPAGLEPAALCLASSIRLSLTARERVCWLDYILDITVPARIVSEDPRLKYRDRFPADYPILLDFYSSPSTRGSKGVPAYGAVHLMSSAKLLPHQGSNKADALSAELQGHMPGRRDVSTLKRTTVNQANCWTKN
jgi:hypothetical protein